MRVTFSYKLEKMVIYMYLKTLYQCLNFYYIIRAWAHIPIENSKDYTFGIPKYSSIFGWSWISLWCTIKIHLDEAMGGGDQEEGEGERGEEVREKEIVIGGQRERRGCSWSLHLISSSFQLFRMDCFHDIQLNLVPKWRFLSGLIFEYVFVPFFPSLP